MSRKRKADVASAVAVGDIVLLYHPAVWLRALPAIVTRVYPDHQLLVNVTAFGDWDEVVWDLKGFSKVDWHGSISNLNPDDPNENGKVPWATTRECIVELADDDAANKVPIAPPTTTAKMPEAKIPEDPPPEDPPGSAKPHGRSSKPRSRSLASCAEAEADKALSTQ